MTDSNLRQFYIGWTMLAFRLGRYWVTVKPAWSQKLFSERYGYTPTLTIWPIRIAWRDRSADR